ncbi:MAG: hypothetical protein JXB88_14860 [Spirochaetales bacterium]|nr:hypothetical protein [Spirochaetales bacterium]
MIPEKSYTIWMTQRNGSTLLCKTLELTGIAGKPEEWLLDYYDNPDLAGIYHCSSITELRERLWEKGVSDNGIFGIKTGLVQPAFSIMMNTLKNDSEFNGNTTEIDVWNYLFPHCQHIFMTRRNKVRLAVSWWKAVQSNEFQRKKGDKKKTDDSVLQYNFDAIKHLFVESSMREAGIQEFFSRYHIIPLTIVYEDFINDFENTIRNVLAYLHIAYDRSMKIPAPYYEKMADDISEQWCKRFIYELQKDWRYKGYMNQEGTDSLRK